MHLVKTSQSHLVELMDWFPDLDSISVWGGPEFRYPFTAESFHLDTKINEIDTYSLVDDSDNLYAFGQFYQRLEHCHLGRLVVSPDQRSKGLGAKFIDLLMHKGSYKLKLNSFSLFVLEGNVKALKLYESLGFKISVYPELIPIDNCLYLVKSILEK